MFIYTKKEVKSFLIASILLSFVFAFNDGRDVFELAYWLSNFAKVFVIVLIGLIVHDMGHDFVVRKQGFNSEFKTWGLKKLNLKAHDTFPKEVKFFGLKIKLEQFPLGVLMALGVMLFSNGKLYWAAVSSYNLIKIKAHRIGRKFEDVTDFEQAKIAFAGPFALLLLTIIFKIFNSSGMFDKAIFIYSVMIVYDMLPLPELDGFKVFMGSRPFFVFSLLFTIVAILLLHTTSAFVTLAVSLLVAIVALVAYMYYFIYK
ncbi:hypothetical protein D6777_04585 [Candidatus Woesearchaeota archaeon]|nr:MAG: hypothetical protein D6777_04585 [Candidatus Woesearchaeota archaeon]